MPDPEDRQRLFLALWPDRSLQSALAEWGRSCQSQSGGRLTPEHNLHATLVFLGELVGTQKDAVCECVAQYPPPRAAMTLDRVGYWPKPGIVWAGSRTAPATMVSYADTLREGLRRIGLRIDPRPWVLHITLIRRARKRPRIAITPLNWSCSEVLLMASTLDAGGARYETLQRWSAPVDMG